MGINKLRNDPSKLIQLQVNGLSDAVFGLQVYDIRAAV